MFAIQTVVIFAVFCGVFGEETKCDKEKCLQVPKHYEELGCTPVTEEGKCCPSRFECPNFKKFDADKCVYKTDFFKQGDKLEESITHPLCAASCFCDSRNGLAKFVCAQIECPDLFRRPDPKCIQQYEAGKCCSSKTICDEAEIEKLPKCEFEGKTYREGQKIYPEKGCYTCTCTKNFENKPVQENPSCKKVDCGISLRNMGRVREGCVPIYYGSDRCCPFEWRCPDEKDEIVNEGRSGTETTEKCEFGKLKLNVGDVVKSSDKCDTCKCTHPPMMHCIKDAECYKSS